MDHLEHPPFQLWADRRIFFESLLGDHHPFASYMVGEQASALVAEIQAVFCCGAWASVIILSVAAIEAQIREVEFPEGKTNLANLLDQIDGSAEYHHLRRRRNSLIHADSKTPALTIDQQWSNRDELEAEARKAVSLLVRVIYLSPWA